MKLEAYLEVVNHSTQAASFKNVSKPIFSELSCNKEQTSNRYYLLVKCAKKNSINRYKIFNNIESVHCKFINEGKATVKLKDPTFSLYIQRANPNELKSFLKILQIAFKSTDGTLGEVLTEQAQNQPQQKPSTIKKLEEQQLKKPQTTLTIQTPSEYKQIKSSLNSPQYSYLTRLQIQNCKLKEIPAHIHNIKSLVYLDLSQNEIEKIQNLSLKNLKELNLSKNHLSGFANDCGLMPNVYFLDLSFNKIEIIKQNFCRCFKSVNTLKLNNNLISNLTNNFGYLLLFLKNLYLSNNNLKYLPFSIVNLRMDVIEIQFNQFYEINFANNFKLNNPFPKLTELSARTVVDKRVRYTKADLPYTLIDYLTSYSLKCVCQKSCFEYNLQMDISLDLNKIAHTFSYVQIGNESSKFVPVKAYFCSLKCYNANKKKTILW